LRIEKKKKQARPQRGAASSSVVASQIRNSKSAMDWLAALAKGEAIS